MEVVLATRPLHSHSLANVKRVTIIFSIPQHFHATNNVRTSQKTICIGISKKRLYLAQVMVESEDKRASYLCNQVQLVKFREPKLKFN